MAGDIMRGAIAGLGEIEVAVAGWATGLSR
jgi:hypothetical protein